MNDSVRGGCQAITALYAKTFVHTRAEPVRTLDLSLDLRTDRKTDVFTSFWTLQKRHLHSSQKCSSLTKKISKCVTSLEVQLKL